MSAKTAICSPWLPIHTGVATLPIPTDATGGAAVPAEWVNENSSSIMVRLSKAAAAMSLAAVQVAIYDSETGAWYKHGPLLNGGTAMVLDSIGYMLEVPVTIKHAERVALVGTPTGSGTFDVAMALVKTQY